MDILTGKQLLFAEPIIKKLQRRNRLLCTTRNYRELNGLVKIRKVSTVSVGRHGGGENLSKTVCSARRTEELARIVYRFRPELAVSFQSPEAARVAFGLGIRHIGFSDSPHASAVMRLTVPYLDKLLIPWMMKKEKFSKYGIPKKDILQYRSIDAAVTCRMNFSKDVKFGKGPKTIIVRMAESQASYNDFADAEIVPIIDNILERTPQFRVVVLPRYAKQIEFLKVRFGGRIKIMQKIPDGRDILRHADVFVGSGGTMTAEAAFLGIPTISYSDRQDYDVDVFLERKKIITREHDPVKISKIAEKLAGKNDLGHKKRVQKLLKTMEDPFPVLEKAMKT